MITLYDKLLKEILVDMSRDPSVGNSAYFVPFKRMKHIEDELKRIEQYIKDKE